MPSKVQYQEGDWFAVPLRTGGFGVGVIARTNRDGLVIGYFFGPRRERPPTLDEVANLEASAALMVRRFGDLGLFRGEWPIIGRTSDWDRSHWPMPVFVRAQELSGRVFRIFYDEDDLHRLREEQVAPGTVEQGPRDGLLSSGAVEVVLTTLLQ